LNEKEYILKIGIIGCGIITQIAHLPALLKLKDKIEVISLCNHSEPKAKKTAELLGNSALPIYKNWQEMIRKEKDLEAVLVSLPIPMNYPVSRQCIEAGLHVICEKPAGVDAKEAALTLELTQKDGPLFMTAENFQYYPGFKKASLLCQEGLIGKVHSLHWNVLQFLAVDNQYNQTQWRNHNEYPGGYVMDGGVHFVHALQMIAGSIDSVVAKTKSINSKLGTMDMGFALLTHQSGAISSLNMGWQHSDQEESLKVFGTEGSLILKEDSILLLKSDGTSQSYPLEAEDSFTEEWKDFYSAVTGLSPLVLNQETVVRDVKVIDALVKSAAEGREVMID
jgi:predicted dehydrogenase